MPVFQYELPCEKFKVLVELNLTHIVAHCLSKISHMVVTQGDHTLILEGKQDIKQDVVKVMKLKENAYLIVKAS